MKFAIPIVWALCVSGLTLSAAMARGPDEGQVVSAFDVSGKMAIVLGHRAEDLTAPPSAGSAVQLRYTAISLDNMKVLSDGALGKGIPLSLARSENSLVVCLFDYEKPPSGLASFYRVDARGCTKLSTLEADCLGSFARDENLYAYSRNSVWRLGRDGVWSKIKIEGPQNDYRWVSMDTSGRGYLLTDGKLWTWENGFSGKAVTASYEGKFSNAALGARLWLCARAGSDTIVYGWEAESASLREVGRIPATYVVQMDADEKGAVFVGLTEEQRGRANRRIFAARNVQGKTVLGEVNKMGAKVRFARISGDLVYLCDELGEIVAQELEPR